MPSLAWAGFGLNKRQQNKHRTGACAIDSCLAVGHTAGVSVWATMWPHYKLPLNSPYWSLLYVLRAVTSQCCASFTHSYAGTYCQLGPSLQAWWFSLCIFTQTDQSSWSSSNQTLTWNKLWQSTDKRTGSLLLYACKHGACVVICQRSRGSIKRWGTWQTVHAEATFGCMYLHSSACRQTVFLPQSMQLIVVHFVLYLHVYYTVHV